MWTRAKRHAPELVAAVLAALFGVFQLALTLAVRTEQSFDTFVMLTPVWGLLAAGCAAWIFVPEANELDDATPAPARRGSDALLLLALIASSALAFDRIGETSFAMIAVVLAGLQMAGGRVSVPGLGPTTRTDAIALGLGAITAVGAYLFLFRPEGDDVFYLSQAIQTSVHSELPVLGFDVMHGDTSLPVQQPAHRAQGYETFVALVYHLSGLHPFDVYFGWLAIPMAALSAVPNWLLARRVFGEKAAAVAVVAIVPLLAIWAGHIFAWGNFGYARLWQGKGLLVTLFLPLLLHFALTFARRPTLRTTTGLMLALCAAAMTTSTALVVAPLAAGLVVLAALGAAPVWKQVVGGLLAVSPVVAMLLLVRSDPTLVAERGYTGSIEGLATVFGSKPRLVVGLAAMLTLPTLLRTARHPAAEWMARFLLVLALVLLPTQGRAWLAERGGALLSWRTFWAAPMPMLITGAFAVSAVTALDHAHRARRAGAMATAALVLVGVTFATTGTYDRVNAGRIRFSVWKMHDAPLAVAERILDVTSPEDSVVVPPVISHALVPMPTRPKVLTIRPMYTQHLEHVRGPAETRQLRRIHGFASDSKSGVDPAFFVDQLDRRCVRALVTTDAHIRRKTSLEQRLRDIGFERRRPNVKPQYQIWVRNKLCTPRPTTGPATRPPSAGGD